MCNISVPKWEASDEPTKRPLVSSGQLHLSLPQNQILPHLCRHCTVTATTKITTSASLSTAGPVRCSGRYLEKPCNMAFPRIMPASWNFPLFRKLRRHNGLMDSSATATAWHGQGRRESGGGGSPREKKKILLLSLGCFPTGISDGQQIKECIMNSDN